MRWRGFCGPSYQSAAATADNEECINLYPERIESPNGTTDFSLLPTPGVSVLVQTNATQGRAHAFYKDREFAVTGASFYELDSDAAVTSRGLVAVDGNPATISYNGDGGGDLLITSGGNGYRFILSSNTFSTISALNGKATMGDQLDGYLLALDANTGTFYASGLLAGGTWTTGTMFAQRNAAPDKWIAMKVKGKYVYLIGPETGEVWYDSGASPFPFAPHPSGLFQYGIAAPFSLQKCGDSMIWLGKTRDGHGPVYRATGFTPENIASYPVQKAISEYTTVSDAYADSYNENGHTFYVLSFPTANVTWCYDLEMQMWHKRGLWNPSDRAFSVWGPRCHAFAFNQHRWLHGTGTGVYRASTSYGSDVDSLAIRRLRRAPTIQSENRRLFPSVLELDVEPGLGLESGQGESPMAMLRISRDGGKTWGPERWRNTGKLGEFSRRVRWERIGAARRLTAEVTFTDPVPFKVTNAYLQLAQQAQMEGAA